jgi:hypothetical protein
MSREPDTLDLRRAAAEAGYAYETFRKAWRDMADPDSATYQRFPMPFRMPPPGVKRGSYAWRASAIAQWKLERESALSPRRYQVGDTAPPPSAPATVARDPRLKRDRAELVTLMQGRA